MATRRGAWRGVATFADGTTAEIELQAEPDWSEDDRQKVHAYLGREAKRCPVCGTFPDEWISDDGRPIEPYEVMSVHCYGDEVLREAREASVAEKATCEHHYLTRRRKPLGGT